MQLCIFSICLCSTGSFKVLSMSSENWVVQLVTQLWCCILTSMPPLPVSQRLAATSCQMSINDQKARSCQSENLIAINCPTLTVGKHKITKPPFRGISPHLILRSCVFFFSPINMCLVQGQCGEAHTGSSITVTWLPPLLSIDQKSCTTQERSLLWFKVFKMLKIHPKE